MNKPILIFFIYGIKLDRNSDGDFLVSALEIIRKIKELLMKDPHQTDVKIMLIRSICSDEKEIFVETQITEAYHINLSGRKDIQDIFIKYLHWCNEGKPHFCFSARPLEITGERQLGS